MVTQPRRAKRGGGSACGAADRACRRHRRYQPAAASTTWPEAPATTTGSRISYPRRQDGPVQAVGCSRCRPPARHVWVSAQCRGCISRVCINCGRIGRDVYAPSADPLPSAGTKRPFPTGMSVRMTQVFPDHRHDAPLFWPAGMAVDRYISVADTADRRQRERSRWRAGFRSVLDLRNRVISCHMAAARVVVQCCPRSRLFAHPAFRPEAIPAGPGCTSFPATHRVLPQSTDPVRPF